MPDDGPGSKRRRDDGDDDRERHRRLRRRARDDDDDERDRVRRSKHSSDEDRDRGHRHRHRKSSHRVDLAAEGIAELTAADFYAASRPFRVWLLEEREKRLDELPAAELHRLFEHRFIRAFNKGKLPRKYYDSSLDSADAPSAVTWSLKRTDAEEAEARRARTAVDTGLAPAGPSRPTIGPAPPPAPRTVAELHERREREREEAERQSRIAGAERSRTRREAKDEERDGRATGRDRLAEKRADTRASNRAFADRRADDAAPDLDDDTLMGGSDSFAAALARERARQTGGGRSAQRQARDEERRVELNERRTAHSAKEAQTMAMFKDLAAARFGP